MSKKAVLAAILAACVMGVSVAPASAKGAGVVPGLLGGTVVIPSGPIPQGGPGPRPPPKN